MTDYKLMDPRDWLEASEPLYAQRNCEALAAQDAAALEVPDPQPVAALQQAVLPALRAGKIFFTAHKEGGTQLKFDGQSFVRWDYGDAPITERFATDEAMLACVRCAKRT